MGVNLWAYKLLAFFIGCVFAGVLAHCWFTTLLSPVLTSFPS
jgi:ABC-type branched-subunit amino acid transport system permease subunit